MPLPLGGHVLWVGSEIDFAYAPRNSAPPHLRVGLVLGGLRHLHKENRRIDRIVAAEFETIDEEEWR